MYCQVCHVVFLYYSWPRSGLNLIIETTWCYSICRWTNSMAVVPKSSGKVCICVNITKLTNAVLCESHLPSVDHVLSKFHLAHAHNCSQPSSLRIVDLPVQTPTFWYQFRTWTISDSYKLIFRIREGLGVVRLMPYWMILWYFQIINSCMMHDSILYLHVYRSLESHPIVMNVLSHMKKYISWPDSWWCWYASWTWQSNIKMQAPRNISELGRFLGVVNQFMKFVPNRTDTTQRLRKLLEQETERLWTSVQSKSF